MNNEERNFAAKTLLLTISAITGWTVPVSETLLILIDQLEKTLSEKYKNVNAKEFEYAFRNRGLEIKDWGKALNLSLVDEIMIPYLEERFELSRVEEQLKTPKMIEEKKEVTKEEMADWIMDWKQMENINIEIIPLPFYDFLDREKIITLTSKQKWEYTQKATSQIKTLLHEDMSVCKTNDAYIAFNKFSNMETTGFTGELKGRILNRAKRLIVYDYLKDKIV